MKKKAFAFTILTVYNIGLLVAIYGAYLITKNAPLLVSANPLFLILIGATYFLLAFLALLILAFDYLFYRKGWQFLFKKKEAEP